MNNMSTLGKGNNLKCAECHAKTVSLASNLVITNTTNHINSYKDYSGIKAGGSVNYTVATGVCSTVYCHSSGQAIPVYRNMTGSKSWGGSAKFDCNGCHGRDLGALWDSGLGAPNYANHSTVSTANSHEKHVMTNGMADTRGCAKCHRNSVDMGIANKMRNYSSMHLNRQRDVAFSIYGIYSSNTKSCTTYCHSNVQAPGGSSAATVYTKPAWGSDNGTMACFSCHVDMATLAETAENLQLGSHRRHAAYNNTTGGSAAAGYSCDLCHGYGYNATTVVGTTHSDGNINVTFTGKGTGTTYSQGSNSVAGNGYGACSTSKCHGRATRNWGINTSLRECEKCHGSARMAKEEGAFKDTAGSTTGSYVGTHVSHLAGSHNLTAPLQCSECHTLPSSINSFDHMSSLPARIVWGVLSVRSSNVRGGDRVAMTPTYNPANKQCTNTYCHAGVQIKTGETVSYQGSKPNPTWNDAGYLGGTGCNMCHGYPPLGLHPSSTVCSACHNHVDQSNLTMADKTKHLNGKVETTVDDCLGCHGHNTGFQGQGDCTGCHAGVQGARRAMQTDFGQASHHISGAWANVTKVDCTACHAEGNYADGSENTTYHTKIAGKPVYLKQWVGTFPSAGSNGTFNIISTTALRRNKRNTYVLTPFCISCHNETNANATPYHDGNTPETYSWDNNSIDSKYSNISTTPWGKFNSTAYNVVPADTVTKAFSAHGNAGQNRMTKSLTTFATYSATSDVQCNDCHNTHSSPVVNGTSYAPANTAGGILKTYSTNYTPTAGGSTATKNAYSASSDLCFDCHLGESGTNEPKNYRSYGIPTGKAIVGYYDRVGISNFSNYSTSRWSTSDVWRGSFAYKDAAFQGGHFGNSLGYTQMTGMGTKINGNCTACHDPHGVSPAIKRGYSRPVQTVKHVTTTGSVTLANAYTGTANASYVYVVQITAGGPQASAQYRAKAFNNTTGTWTTATACTTAWTKNGVTATFGAGNYSVNDTWTWQVGANPNYMTPALKGTWMHSPYKEDRAPRKSYTTDPGPSQGSSTIRLAGIAKANDYTDYVPNASWFTSIRLWDDSAAGVSSTGSTRRVGGPAPRGNPDFKTGSYVPGYNIPAVIGDGFGQGMSGRGYGSGFSNISSYKGWNGFFIDENTFGTSVLKTYWSSTTAPLFATRMTSINKAAKPGNFAGLCLQCHAWAKNSGTALNNVTSSTLGMSGNTNTRILTKPHETVSGLSSGITVDLMRRGNNYSAGTWSTATNVNSDSGRAEGYIHGIWNVEHGQGDGNAYAQGVTGQVRQASATVTRTDPNANTSSDRSHYYRWAFSALQRTVNTIDASYHQFPCAKCHTPHVSRLPRLMKTNCLDNDNVGAAHTTMAYVSRTSNFNNMTGLMGALYRNVACHSTKIQGNNRTGNSWVTGGGWNNKTPW